MPLNLHSAAVLYKARRSPPLKDENSAGRHGSSHYNNTAPEDSLWFVPLGGTSEIGMNMSVYGYKGKMLIVDMGRSFDSEMMPAGTDLIVPDPQFALDNKDKIAGLVLTHAHEDHIGVPPSLPPARPPTPFSPPPINPIH